jgi:hypothetical protein
LKSGSQLLDRSRKDFAVLPSHLADSPWVDAVRPGGDRTRLPVGLSLFALAVGTFGIGTTEFVIMGLLPQVAAGLGVTVPEAGHLISAYALGVVVGAPLLAGASVTFPRRTVLIALMGTFAIGNLASAMAPDMGSLMLIRFLTGLPHGAFFGAASVAGADVVPLAVDFGGGPMIRLRSRCDRSRSVRQCRRCGVRARRAVPVGAGAR